MDPRTRKLAKFVCRKLNVQKNQTVIIAGGTEAEDFIRELYKEVILLGAHPLLRVSISGLSTFFYNHAKEHQLSKYPDSFEYQIKNADKFIGINTTPNTRELTGVDPKKITARAKVMKPISDLINQNPKMKRCTVAYPCMSLAQEAEMDLTDYENFVYSACLQDWEKVGKLMKTVLNKFQAGKKVHLLGNGVDLKFEINGKRAMSDLSGENIPMGEVFMAPKRESLNGWIHFEYPAIRGGKEVTDVKLKFENGKVIEASASKNQDFLPEMLKTDENASYVGEFGIGLNPKVNKFTKDLLFDEKMGGTIHLALGMAYVENGGGNDSAIHWDIVKDMRKAKIILDGKVVQENGIWKI